MMTVCKFFIRGSCNRGDSCRFEHILPDEDNTRGAGYGDSRGTSVLKRDSSSTHEGSSGYSDQSYYNEPKNYNVYKKYNDRNAQNQSASYYNDYSQSSKKYNDRSVQNNLVTVDNDFYHSSPIKQNDPQFYGSQKYANDRYHFDSRQSRHQQHQVNQRPAEISIDELYVLLKSDLNFIEKCRSWPLTSYCIVKLFGSLEDWYDYSPEELRLAAYIAKASNNFEGFKATIDKIVAHAEAVRDFYKNMSKETSAKLRAYVKQSSATIHPLINNELDFTQINYSSISLSSNSNDFGSMQPSVSEPFQQPAEDTEMFHSVTKLESGFGSQSSMAALDFGSVIDPKPSANIFGGFQQEKLSTNVFGGTSQVQETPPHSNVFGSTSNDNPSFGSLIDNTSSFGSHRTQGGVSSSQYNFSIIPQGPRDLKTIYPNLIGTDLDLEILSLMWKGDSPYSIHSELTEEELEQFKASSFTIGKVPLIPPSKELC